MSIYSANDALNQDHEWNEIDTEIENAYRDGYLAGANSIYESIKKEVDKYKLERYIRMKRLEGYMDRLSNWRYKQSKDKRIHPPKINQ